MSTSEQLLTAEEYLASPKIHERSELVRGVIVPMTPPGFRHSLVCAEISYLLKRHLEDHDVGRVLSNDGGIITQRNPDTVRGGDVSFYSYERQPRDDSPAGYVNVSPNVVFEVRSPNDRWREIHEKIAEYLAVGVEAVCVILPETRTVHVFYLERDGEILQGDDVLRLPAPLEEFQLPVSRFFESV